jgi:signal peptidase I
MRGEKMINFIKSWSLPFIIALIIWILIRAYIIDFIVIKSGSMLPTVNIGDHYVVNKMVKLKDIKDGDMITFYPPIDYFEGKIYIKRVIGTPGDKIEIKNGSLYRNDKKISENYIKKQMNYKLGPIKVPKGSIFVLGDNRNESFDSHLWRTPFIEEKQLSGKVIFRYWNSDIMKWKK